MIKIAIWIAIILLLILLRDRITNAIFGGLFLVCITVFSVFMIDEFTTFELRKFGKKPMNEYDKLRDDPSGVIGGVVGEIKDYGEGVKDNVNKKGDELDGKYGTSIEGEEDKMKEKEDKEKEKEEIKKGKEKSMPIKKGENKLGTIREVGYKDVPSVLSGELKNMGERDKDLVKSLVPMLELHYVGDDYEVWNDKEMVYIAKIKK